MGHLAVTDEAGHRFVAFERLAREGLRLAGAGDERVWVEDWSLRPRFPISLTAGEAAEAALALTLAAGRGPILHSGWRSGCRSNRRPIRS